jgi:hypothetical protein
MIRSERNRAPNHSVDQPTTDIIYAAGRISKWPKVQASVGWHGGKKKR